MNILGIESSCDDICVGIVNEKREIYADIRLTKEAKTGVIPEVVARNHLQNVDLLVTKALDQAGIKLEDIDIFAATAGPGLVNGLVVGFHFANTLAANLKKRFIPIHHLEAHMSVCKIDFPFLVLLVSGGHTMIIKCIDFLNYETLVTTTDDAAGEFIDKVGRFLGFDFPAGAELEKIADSHNEHLTVPTRGKLEFSFSGIKTKCLRLNHSKEYMAALIQNTIAATIKEKLNLLNYNLPIIFCGGVAANKRIRELLSEFNMVYPPIHLCVDNGVMVALCALNYISYNVTCNDVFSKCSLEEWKLLISS